MNFEQIERENLTMLTSERWHENAGPCAGCSFQRFGLFCLHRTPSIVQIVCRRLVGSPITTVVFSPSDI